MRHNIYYVGKPPLWHPAGLGLSQKQEMWAGLC